MPLLSPYPEGPSAVPIALQTSYLGGAPNILSGELRRDFPQLVCPLDLTGAQVATLLIIFGLIWRQVVWKGHLEQPAWAIQAEEAEERP